MGNVFSDEPDIVYPQTGKPMTVRVQCSHKGASIDMSTHRGHRITSDWNAAQLQEAIEEQTGVHHKCQTLMFAGRPMSSGSTLGEMVRSDTLPSRMALFMVVDREAFPQKLGPFRPVRVPFEAEDFVLPELTEEFKRAGFYWELKTGILESHGMAARAAKIVGQVSPTYPLEGVSDWLEAAGAPPGAAEFCWSYPVADWERVESDAYALDSWAGLQGSAAMKSFLTVGGFLYLDARGQVAGATTPGRPPEDEDGSLTFLEPRRWASEWSRRLAEQGRFQPVTMRSLAALGTKMFCWLRPGEILEDGDGQPFELQPEVPRGGFVYLFHDDVLATDPSQTALDRYFPVAPSGWKPDAGDSPSGLFRPFSLAYDDVLQAPETRGTPSSHLWPSILAEPDEGSDRDALMDCESWTMSTARDIV